MDEWTSSTSWGVRLTYVAEWRQTPTHMRKYLLFILTTFPNKGLIFQDVRINSKMLNSHKIKCTLYTLQAPVCTSADKITNNIYNLQGKTKKWVFKTKFLKHLRMLFFSERIIQRVSHIKLINYKCDTLYKKKSQSLSRLNGLYTPFTSPVPGGQKPQNGRRTSCLRFLLQKINVQNSMFKVAGW